MKASAEVTALIVICFCFTVGAAYLWGYSAGSEDARCLPVEGE